MLSRVLYGFIMFFIFPELSLGLVGLAFLVPVGLEGVVSCCAERALYGPL